MLAAGQEVGQGRYTLVRFLRAGGAGVVWEARDRRPRRGEAAEVAIKVLDAAAGGADTAAREAEVAARVRHPGVVRVRDTFTADGLACMVMDLAVGSLADLVAREGPLPPPVALGCAIQACEALAAAHLAGVVHRDVKPHNLLVFADGSVRLADFGAARALMDGHTRTRTGALLGSIPFMAPEQRRDARAVRPATDVYALAVTLGWLLLGEAPDDPWSDEAAAQLRSVGVPEGLVRAFAMAGARRAEDRPADGTALRALLGGCGVVPAPVQLPAGWQGVREDAPRAAERSAAPRGRWGLAAVVAGAVGIVGAVGVAGIVGPAEVSAWGKRGEEAVAAATALPACGDGPADWVERVQLGPREAMDAVVADVDGDGHNDALFTNQYDENVTIWWGRKGDTPLDHSDIQVGRSSVAPEVADVNGDGRNDLILTHDERAAVALVLADGPRTFANPVLLDQAPPATRIAARDFDGDSRVDLLLTHAPTIADVNLRRGEPTDLFLAPHRLVGSVRPPTHVLPSSSWSYAQLIASDKGSAAAYAIGQNGLLQEMATLTTSFTDLWPVHLPATGGPYPDALLVGKSAEGRHTVLKWDGRRACELAPLGEAVNVRAGGDVNGDGIMDLLGTRSCRACTSNHVLFLGRP